jgi:tRNA pseudouridine13 synthase
MTVAPLPAGGWPRVLGEPGLRGRLRVEPEDFRVEELPLVTPSGKGNHLWLEIEKRNANTAWVAGQLARAAGVRERDVGYAGLKDRHAVTTQWFSIGLQEAADDDHSNWRIPDVRILGAARHDRKLRRGALRGNRFRIRVCELEGDVESLVGRVQRLDRRGFPNYFGPQRFGRAGANVARGLSWLRQGGRVRRSERSLFISAVRSALFNQLLAERVRRDLWDRLVDGDVVSLDGSRSTFVCSLPDAELEGRCADFDLHPSGPLPGRPGRARVAERQAAGLEAAALAPYDDVVDLLARAGVEADRRPLRVRAVGLEARLDGGDLRLEFSLPAGAYATAVMRELVLTGPDTISSGA